MYERYLLPANEQGPDALLDFGDLAIGTCRGRIKRTNEDYIGYVRLSQEKQRVRLCICDGHWGGQAAQIIADYWLKPRKHFPQNKPEAISAVQGLQTHIKKLTPCHPEGPPEAAFIAAELGERVLRMVSFGDCRSLVARQEGCNSHQVYHHTGLATWLGALTFSGHARRLPVERATQFRRLELEPRDVVILYTDGLDECIYETPTIATKTIAHTALLDAPGVATGNLLKLALEKGGEDNVSVAVLQVR
jgi:serine/threonine protein phosphatase PrpC